MVFNTPQDIFNRIKNPKNSYRLNKAVKLYHTLRMFITGEGYLKYLKKVEGLDNDQLFKIRKQLANENTVPVLSTCLKPIDKVFSSQGSMPPVHDFSGNNDELKKRFNLILSDVAEGKSISEWSKIYWKTKVNIDPNAIAFIEIDKDSADEEIVIYNCDKFFDYDTRGVNVEYVIFNPLTDKQGNKFYRVVDDKMDYFVKRDGKDNFSIVLNEISKDGLYSTAKMSNKGIYSLIDTFVPLEDSEGKQYKTLENYFGYCPAVILSNNLNPVEKIKSSWIDEAIPILEDYFLYQVLHKIYLIKQAVPRVYEHKRTCSVCEGTGKKDDAVCPECAGDGIARHTDYADRIIVEPPQPGDAPFSPPAGFISMDVTTIEQQLKTLDRLIQQIFEAIWGIGSYSSNQQGSSDKTAYEISVRRESEFAKLNHIADNVEEIEKRLIFLIGKKNFGDNYKGSLVKIGRNFISTTWNESLNLLAQVKKDNLPAHIYYNILTDFWASKFEIYPDTLERMLILSQLEPFLNYSIDDLNGANIATEFEIDYIIKVYFIDFINRFERENNNLFYYKDKIDEVKAKLILYAEEVKAANKKEEVIPDPNIINPSVKPTDIITE